MITSKYAMAIATSLVIFSPNFAKSADVYDARNDALADPAPVVENHSGAWAAIAALYEDTRTDATDFHDDKIEFNRDGFGVSGRLGYDHYITAKDFVRLFAELDWHNLDAASVENGDYSVSVLAGYGRSIGYGDSIYGAVGIRWDDVRIDTLPATDDEADLQFEKVVFELGYESRITQSLDWFLAGQYAKSIGGEKAPDGVIDGLADGTDVDEDVWAVKSGVKVNF